MKQYKNIGDILYLIEGMKAMSPDMAAHAATLLGPRTRGSTTLLGIESLDPTINLNPLVGDRNLAEGCRAFVFRAFELGGRLGSLPAKDVLSEHPICIRNGSHGPELFIDRPVESARLPYISTFTVILGDHEGQEVVYTWHPGYPLRPFDGKTILLDTAVKLHNGQ